MKEMTMLDLAVVDLGTLAEALEDHSLESSWWFDPATGEIEPHSDYDDSGEKHPSDRGLRWIEPTPSHESYADMEDFTARVRDPRPRELLERSLGGRGAFRRFKDTLFEFPDLRAAWFAFHDARMERRALEWLAHEGLVERAAAEREMGARSDPEPPELSGPFDPHAIARAVAADLRELYGERLVRVVLFGSWARGDAHPESDIDLLVVLDPMESIWDELRAMRKLLDRHSDENDTVVSALPVAAVDFETPGTPTLIRASIEGVAVG